MLYSIHGSSENYCRAIDNHCCAMHPVTHLYVGLQFIAPKYIIHSYPNRTCMIQKYLSCRKLLRTLCILSVQRKPIVCNDTLCSVLLLFCSCYNYYIYTIVFCSIAYRQVNTKWVVCLTCRTFFTMSFRIVFMFLSFFTISLQHLC